MAITQAELKELLHYDQDTGVFTWRISCGAAKAGTRAGGIKSCNGSEHRVIRIKTRRYQEARLAFLYMTGSFPGKKIMIDHIDNDATDNKWDNIKKTTKNLHKKLNNKSMIVGVHLDNNYKKWIAKITISGEIKFLGSYDNIFDAACARKSAEIKYGLRP